MTDASITSLGVGSGLDLQDILDQLKEVDRAPIDAKQDEITVLESRLEDYDAIKSVLYSMKSYALNLSMESGFLERSVSVSDEDIVTATAIVGASESSNNIEVSRLASTSSWQSDGFDSADTIAYIPTSLESETGYATAGATPVITADSTITLTYGAEGDQQTITVDLTSGMSLDQIVNAINTDPDNDDGEGSTYVTATAFQGDDSLYYLRIASTDPENTEANRLTATTVPDDLTLSAPDLEITYSLGDSGSPVTVSVAADTTYSELATLINEDSENAGVTASVIDDGGATNPYRFILVANSSGEDNRISISGLSMTEVSGAGGASLNASLSVNGIAYERQSNSGISDIIQGVTLTIGKVGTSTVSVTSNNESIRSNIASLVTSFNELVTEIQSKTAYDEETETWGSLSRSVSLKNLSSELKSLFSTFVEMESGSSYSLFDLGLEFNRDGTITIDEEVLDEAIGSDIENIRQLFIGNEDEDITGLGELLNSKLLDLTISSGLIDTEKEATQTQIDRLEEDIEAATKRLDARYEVLTQQFVQLDTYMNQMQAQSNYLTNVFNSFNQKE